MNEKYQADVYFEARWTEHGVSLNTLNLTTQQKEQLNENTLVKITDFDRMINWSPQLFIENAIAQIGGQERWFTVKKADSGINQPSSPLFVSLDICEHRRMKGVFWEKLELNHVSVMHSSMRIRERMSGSLVSSGCSRSDDIHCQSSSDGKVYSCSRSKDAFLYQSRSIY